MFAVLLQMVPGLEERLMAGSDEDLVMVADLVSCENPYCWSLYPTLS